MTRFREIRLVHPLSAPISGDYGQQRGARSYVKAYFDSMFSDELGVEGIQDENSDAIIRSLET